MVIDWQIVARVVAIVVMVLAAYLIGVWRGRDEGFTAALIGVATKNIKVGSFDIDGADDDADVLDMILRSMGDDDDE